MLWIPLIFTCSLRFINWQLFFILFKANILVRNKWDFLTIFVYGVKINKELEVENQFLIKINIVCHTAANKIRFIKQAL